MLSGWGHAMPSAATLARVGSDDVEGLRRLLAGVGRRGAIARGLGRSYGDSAQNAGGTAIELTDPAPQVGLDPERGTVTASAGTSLDVVLRTCVPRGWFLPVTPGTRFVTVGGAIASDIHGKNHHVDGTFGRHVRELEMMLADGTIVTVGPERWPDLFWATVGGMGLTGIILRATFGMLPIETSRCTVDTERVGDLDALLEAMETGDAGYRYSVAWIDLVARGAALGRSVLTRAEHARLDELSPRQSVRPLAYAPSRLASVPPVALPAGVLNHATVSAFNEGWFRATPRRRVGQVMSLTRFFHPLDGVAHWNRLYGRRGLLQYQFVVPTGAEETLRTVVGRLAASGTASFLAVLKRFGASNPAPLSFPFPGWTLALDLPAATPGLGGLLAGLDELVLAAGGRHYLAKDSATTPDAIRRGYPRLADWQRVRDEVDPHGRWVSDQSRRLRLTGRS
jgi:decaprenylphospho-beta-D-ribofuranose 2-oxidase